MKKSVILSLAFLVILSACGTSEKPPYQGVKLGKPYVIAGQVYSPAYNPAYDEVGVASWYGPGFHGGRTASGERYDQEDMTAAHKTLPLPSLVRVTNLDNGRSTIIRVNDRGPFASGRIIDVSRAAAAKLGMLKRGTAQVRVQFLDKETREYVSNLPNGRQSLAALDRRKVIPPAVVTGRGEVADNKPLLFAAPSYLPQSVSQPGKATIEPVAWKTENPTIQASVPATIHAGSEVYFIQAGTFGVKANADRMLQALTEIGNAKAVETTIRQKKYYRVLAGPYYSWSDAANMKGKLGNVGISGAKIVRD